MPVTLSFKELNMWRIVYFSQTEYYLLKHLETKISTALLDNQLVLLCYSIDQICLLRSQTMT